MADPTTREALMLMLGPPTQLAQARAQRAARDGRHDVAALWVGVVEHLQQAVDIGVVAAQRDKPVAP